MRTPDGDPLVVVRPPDPAKCLALAMTAVETNDESAFAEAATGPATFVGCLVLRDGRTGAVDERGHVSQLEPGDLVVPLSSLERMASA